MSSGIIIFEPAQEPVSDAGHRLRELLKSAAEAILELDSQDRIVLLNRMAE